MKTTLFLLCFMSLICAFAQQKKEGSIMRFHSSDNCLLKLKIDNRFFNKIARTITVAEIPEGKHTIQVYSAEPFSTRPGEKLTEIYNGTIRTYDAIQYTCTIDPFINSMDVKEKEASEVFYSYSGQNAMHSEKVNSKILSLLNAAELTQFKVSLIEQSTDVDKFKKAIELSSAKQLNTVQVEEIIKLFLFESTRLDFIKSIHNKIVDKENIKVLKTYFELNSSKEAIDSL
jgi:Domain of unknown function (DUF4476)